jgi:hypothetical protein
MRLGSLRTIISGRMQEGNLKCYMLLLWLLIFINMRQYNGNCLTYGFRSVSLASGPNATFTRSSFLFSYFTLIVVVNCVSDVFTAIACQCFDVAKFQDVCCVSYGEGFLRWNKQETLKCTCHSIS